jgi:hypothetical protein
VRGVAARRKEKLLAVDLIGRDRVKARHRRKPFVPYPRVAVFDLWPFCRINENTAIGIEQNRVTFGKDFRTLPVLEIEPGSAILAKGSAALRTPTSVTRASTADVRCGSKADVTLLNFDVRFTPESGH